MACLHPEEGLYYPGELCVHNTLEYFIIFISKEFLLDGLTTTGFVKLNSLN